MRADIGETAMIALLREDITTSWNQIKGLLRHAAGC